MLLQILLNLLLKSIVVDGSILTGKSIKGFYARAQVFVRCFSVNLMIVILCKISNGLLDEFIAEFRHEVS